MYHINIKIGETEVIIDDENRAIARGIVALAVAHPDKITVVVTKTTEPKEKAVSFAGLTTVTVTPLEKKKKK